MYTPRTFRLAAVGAALLVGSAAALAAQAPTTPHARHGQADAGARRDGRMGGPGRRVAGALFRGITLTEAQKAQVRTIHQRYATQQRALAKDLREKSGLTGEQRPDSAARARLRSQMRTLAQAQMEQQAAELRGVLTADQRATFDANVATMRERMKARAAGGATDGPGRRGGRRGA